MLLINEAYAQETQEMTLADGDVAPMPEAASPWELFGTNIAVVIVLILLFYVLLIMPQQRRLKEHTKMLHALQKGDKVVTGGGLLGTIERVYEDRDEVVIKLSDDVKVTALRSTIHAKDDPRLRQNKDDKDGDDKKEASNDKDAASGNKKAGGKK